MLMIDYDVCRRKTTTQSTGETTANMDCQLARDLVMLYLWFFGLLADIAISVAEQKSNRKHSFHSFHREHREHREHRFHRTPQNTQKTQNVENKHRFHRTSQRTQRTQISQNFTENTENPDFTENVIYI